MLIRQTLGSVLLNVGTYGVLLFLPAWTWHWPHAWILMAIVAVGTVVTMELVFRDNEELLKERMKPPIQKDQPRADKLVVVALLLAFFGQIMFIPVDLFHLHFLAPAPAWLQRVGLGLFAIGWILISLVFKQNAFAAPVVKHQKERDQRVIDTGLYGWVRHPMYTGMAFLLPGMALWLGSVAGAWAALAPIGVLAVRTFVEEGFLKRELAGYSDYTKRVRWRLIPGIW